MILTPLQESAYRKSSLNIDSRTGIGCRLLSVSPPYGAENGDIHTPSRFPMIIPARGLPSENARYRTSSHLWRFNSVNATELNTWGAFGKSREYSLGVSSSMRII